jgi:leucyl-tRNA synthetase
VLLDQYGADTTRLFCLFAAPPERDLEWSEQGVDGSYRFLQRVWRLAERWLPMVADASAAVDADALNDPYKELYRKTHETIKRVTQDIDERFHFNTAISAVMELVNTLQAIDADSPDAPAAACVRFALETTVLLLSPLVPHFCEELWEELGHSRSILLTDWPTFDAAAAIRDEVEVVVQVNGKLRSRFPAARDADPDLLKQTALADPRVTQFVGDKPIKKVITVKNKLVNIVI